MAIFFLKKLFTPTTAYVAGARSARVNPPSLACVADCEPNSLRNASQKDICNGYTPNCNNIVIEK